MVDFAKKVQKKGAEHLHPGEEVVAAVPWQRPGSFGKQLAITSGGLVGAAIHAATNRDKSDDTENEPAAAAADAWDGKQAILAVTSQRVLLFSQGAMSGAPKDVVAEWSHDQVTGLHLVKQKLTHRVEMTFADGSTAEGEIVRAAKPERFAESFRATTGAIVTV